MQAMDWTWEDLIATPNYVRRYCLDFLNMIAKKRMAGQVQGENQGDATAL